MISLLGRWVVPVIVLLPVIALLFDVFMFPVIYEQNGPLSLVSTPALLSKRIVQVGIFRGKRLSVALESLTGC